jgi:hypothetical protein
MSHGGCVVEPFGRLPINPYTGCPYCVDEIQQQNDAMKIGDFIEHCSVCTEEIKTMTFRGTGVCCEDCRKVRAGEHDEERALAP